MSKYDRDSRDVYAVKRLGDEIGYGHLMAIAHELWARHLESKGLPRKGAHVAVGYPMVKDEYQADALNDPIYTILVGRALEQQSDTPQTDEEYINNLPWTEVGNGEQTDSHIAGKHADQMTIDECQLFADILFDKDKQEQFLKECEAIGIKPSTEQPDCAKK